jgi:hypothetical protein
MTNLDRWTGVTMGQTNDKFTDGKQAIFVAQILVGQRSCYFQ